MPFSHIHFVQHQTFSHFFQLILIKQHAAHKVSISFFFLLIPGNAWLDSLLFKFSINFLIISILYLFTSLFRINEQKQITRCTNKLVIQAKSKYSFNRRVPKSNPFSFFSKRHHKQKIYINTYKYIELIVSRTKTNSFLLSLFLVRFFEFDFANQKENVLLSKNLQ